MVSFRPYALCVLAVALAAACGDGSPDGAATPSPAGVNLTEVTVRQGDVHLTLSVDKAAYAEGEPVSVSASVENRGGTPAGYVVVGQDGRPIEFAVINGLSGQSIIKSEDAQETPGARTLEAGGMLTREQMWDRSLDMYQTPVDAPPGEYSISAKVLLATSAGSAPLEAFVTFELEGGRAVVTPESAIAVAVRAPEVQSWFTERSPESGFIVCAYGQRGLFYSAVVATGDVAETFDILYQDQLTAGLPICSVVTDGENWLVLFSGPSGPPPQRINALVDLHDGSLQGVELSARTPRPTP